MLDKVEVVDEELLAEQGGTTLTPSSDWIDAKKGSIVWSVSRAMWGSEGWSNSSEQFGHALQMRDTQRWIPKGIGMVGKSQRILTYWQPSPFGIDCVDEGRLIGVPNGPQRHDKPTSKDSQSEFTATCRHPRWSVRGCVGGSSIVGGRDWGKVTMALCIAVELSLRDE